MGADREALAKIGAGMNSTRGWNDKGAHHLKIQTGGTTRPV